MRNTSSSLPCASMSRRNCTGSALAAAASSSMNDSKAKVTCGPLGSRRLPVRSGVSQIIGRPTTRVVSAPIRNRVHHRGRLGRAPGGLRRSLAHELRNQHGVRFVVPEVVVVQRADVVLERDHLALGIEAAAQLEDVARAPWYPTPSPRCASTARAPGGPVHAPGMRLRSRHRRRPCGRTPAVRPCRRRAPSRAAFRGTRRRRCAGRRPSCRWSRSSSARRRDRPARAPGRWPCVPGREPRTRPR